MTKRALISVSDKAGIVEFAQELKQLGWDIISTGGTKVALDKAGVDTIAIDDVTGFPEMMDGRVKTLHPNIHGGLLARRDLDSHLEAAKKLLDMGAQNVMIAMAGDGAYLVTKDHVYHASAAVGTAVNSVGAGDSMIAGFVGTYYKTHNVVEALKVGSACGGATAFTEDIAVKSQIDAVLPQITVEEVK